jgi:hypothetical protein
LQRDILERLVTDYFELLLLYPGFTVVKLILKGSGKPGWASGNADVVSFLAVNAKGMTSATTLGEEFVCLLICSDARCPARILFDKRSETL